MSGTVGRERELAALERLIAPGEVAFSTVVVEGEAGIGKSTVWQACVDGALANGMAVLSCRPVQAEAKLAFASLADLLGNVIDDYLGKLAAPQRFALEVALLRALPRGGPPDRRAVGTAVVSVFRRLAAARAVLVAIDDVQWLDRDSSAALAFALRRVRDVPVRTLVAARVENGVAAEVPGVEGDEAGRVQRLRLGPMSLGAIHQVIRARLGIVFPRPTLRRITQASGGNPLFSLELARALTEVGATPGPGEPLPVPGTLSALVGGRLGRLPSASREALLVAASLASPEQDLVAQAIGRPAGHALDAAERKGLVSLRDGRVAFAHPLIASTVYSSATQMQRRAVHGRLAQVVRDRGERARHLALAATSPDEAVAGAVEAAAREAELRGALEVAVELAELSCALTPDDRVQECGRRTLRLCEYAFRSGDTGRARRLLDGMLENRCEGELRAGALELLARLLHVAGTSAEAVKRCEEALAHVGQDPMLQARVHATLACVSWYDFELAREHARAALDLLEGLDEPDPEVLGQALVGFIAAEFYTGHGLPRGAVERALELERLSPAASVSDRVSAALGAWLKVDGNFEEARRWLEKTHRAAVEEGDDASLPYVVGHMPQLELWTGNWPEAERYALEHLELSETMGQPDQRRQALYNLSLVHAHQGRVEEALREAQELYVDAERAGDRWGLGNALSVLGFIELSLGDPAEAAAHLERNLELGETMGRTEPLRSFGDLAEALIELGSLDQAAHVIAVLETRARDAKRLTLLAVSASCRGMLEAELGNLDGALAALEEAASMQEQVPVPFDHARLQLVLGRVLRRRGERRAAKDALDSAMETFKRLGAPLWAARAQADISRIPLRRRAPDTLTSTEEQVAQLAASGKTNREVAQALFISPKTVEANLARAYRKLGVRSRAELGATLARRRDGALQSKP